MLAFLLFTEQKVSHEILDELLHAAFSAPTAANAQLWEYVIIDDEGILDKDLWVCDCSAAIFYLPLIWDWEAYGVVSSPLNPECSRFGFARFHWIVCLKIRSVPAPVIDTVIGDIDTVSRNSKFFRKDLADFTSHLIVCR